MKLQKYFVDYTIQYSIKTEKKELDVSQTPNNVHNSNNRIYMSGIGEMPKNSTASYSFPYIIHGFSIFDFDDVECARPNVTSHLQTVGFIYAL